jgi:hypothetical protein
MKATWIVVLFVAAGNAGAACWPESDLVRKAAWASNAAILIDWGQTRYIADNPERYKEDNRHIGPHPTTGDVSRYFIQRLIQVNFTACVLGRMGNFGEKLQGAYWGYQIIYNMRIVKGNYEIGIRVDY